MASEKKHTRGYILPAFLVVLGLLVIIAPVVFNIIEQNESRNVIAQQEETSSSLSLKAAYEYNALLASGQKSNDINDDTAMEEYNSLLNANGDLVMGVITLPSIHTKLPIYHEGDDILLQHGAGHFFGSSLPVGGESTHSVIIGHTGLPSARLFDSIDRLEEGDWFIITVAGEDLAYEVTGSEVVLPQEVSSLAIREGEDLVTLVTCTPYGVNTHRLLVHAKRIDIPQEWAEQKYDENDIIDDAVDAFRGYAPEQMYISIGGTIIIFFVIGVAVGRYTISAAKRHKDVNTLI